MHDYLRYALLTGLAIAQLIAAYTDIRRRQIDNWLTGAIAAAAPLYWWSAELAIWPEMVWQLGLALLTLAVLTILFITRAMGGGDVKLLSALALWIKPVEFPQLLLVMSLVGGGLTLAMLAWHLLRRQPGRLAVPYGVAIATAALWVLALRYWPGWPGPW